MELYTLQLGQWRKAKARDVPVHDITLRSGNRAFSPTPKLLGDYKQGRITVQEYTAEFYSLMRTSYVVNRKEWDSLVTMPCVGIACYCKAGDFCHRHLLKDMLEAVCAREGIPFTYCGEIET